MTSTRENVDCTPAEGSTTSNLLVSLIHLALAVYLIPVLILVLLVGLACIGLNWLVELAGRLSPIPAEQQPERRGTPDQADGVARILNAPMSNRLIRQSRRAAVRAPRSDWPGTGFGD